MLRIALCDNDPVARAVLDDALRIVCAKHDTPYELLDYRTSGELLAAPFDYNLLFLDTVLENGADGIAVGRELRRRGNLALFVLTAAQADRSLEGYSAGVLRYLVKPLRREALEEAMAAVLSLLRLNRRILEAPFNHRTQLVPYGEIILVESYMRRRFIHTRAGKLQTSMAWPELCRRFDSQADFFRPQKYYIVNLDYVRIVSRNSVTMAEGHVINFAKGRFSVFHERLRDHLGRGPGLPGEAGG